MVESRESVTWTDEQVFWLQFPRNKYALEIAYHTMKVTQLWWMFQKEAKILSLCHCQVFLFKRSFLLILYFPGGGQCPVWNSQGGATGLLPPRYATVPGLRKGNASRCNIKRASLMGAPSQGGQA